jgi:zinc transporter ZupT
MPSGGYRQLQAEDLGLAFVAGTLMMARLEAVQTEILTLAGRGSDEHL